MTFIDLPPGSWFLVKVELSGDYTRLYMKIQDEKAVEVRSGRLQTIGDETRVIRILP